MDSMVEREEDGRLPSGAGLSPTVEPASSLDGFATSIPDAVRLPDITEMRDEFTVLIGAQKLFWRAVQRSNRCVAARCADYQSPNCICMATYRHLSAQGIAAGTDETPQAAQPEGQEPGPQDAPVSSRLTDDEGGS